MIKLNVPKRVTFVARYKRIPRDQLPPNKVMRRTYTQRAAPRVRRCRRVQKGNIIFNFAKKVVRNPLIKPITRKKLEYVPGVYQNLNNRVKNKTLNRILNSSMKWIELGQLEEGQGKLFSPFLCPLFYKFLTPKNYKLRP